jgi:site-specific recombinase XerD
MYIGSHLLRHSLATNMLRKGASLDEIGDVLRHRSRSSTASLLFCSDQGADTGTARNTMI